MRREDDRCMKVFVGKSGGKKRKLYGKIILKWNLEIMEVWTGYV
jgi:hypothetical protein